MQRRIATACSTRKGGTDLYRSTVLTSGGETAFRKKRLKPKGGVMYAICMLIMP